MSMKPCPKLGPKVTWPPKSTFYGETIPKHVTYGVWAKPFTKFFRVFSLIASKNSTLVHLSWRTSIRNP